MRFRAARVGEVAGRLHRGLLAGMADVQEARERLDTTERNLRRVQRDSHFARRHHLRAMRQLRRARDEAMRYLGQGAAEAVGSVDSASSPSVPTTPGYDWSSVSSDQHGSVEIELYASDREL